MIIHCVLIVLKVKTSIENYTVTELYQIRTSTYFAYFVDYSGTFEQGIFSKFKRRNRASKERNVASSSRYF